MQLNGDKRTFQPAANEYPTAEQYRDIIERIPIGVYRTTPEGKIIEANLTLAKILGYETVDALKRVNFSNVFLNRPERVALLERLRSSGMDVSEFELLRKDGRRIWIRHHTRATFDPKGDLTFMEGVLEEITERKQTENFLRENEERFRKVFEEGPLGMTIAHADRHFVRANAAFCNLLGYSEEELMCLKFTDVTHPEDIDLDLEIGGKMLKGDIQTYRIEKRYVKKDGSIVPVQVTVSLIRDSDGKPQYTLAMIEDISERNRIQRELKLHSDHLEELVERRTRELKHAERLATIGETAAMVAHDLRNPLQAISAAAYIIGKKLSKRGRAANRETRKMLEVIENGIEYADKVVGDLLEISKEVHLQLARTTPRALVEKTIADVVIPAKIHVENFSSDQTIMLVDVQKMERVLMNLINNAIEAMPKGGMVKLRSVQSEDSVYLYVTDTGSGMTGESLQKLWMPLRTTKPGGVGLGLLISRRIVEAHGGSLSATSAPGKGSEFIIRLPIQ